MTATAPRCEARTGYAAGDFGEVPVWCNRAIALGSFEDAQGVIRHACQAPHHREQVERLYGVMPEQADPMTQAKARADLERGVAHFDEPAIWQGCEVEVVG